MSKNEILQKKLRFLSGLNELDARLYVGLWAVELGWGGILQVHKLTGKSMDTIRKGISEISTESYKELKESGRIRREGGGRKKIIEKYPQVKKDLEDIMDENTAGDPMSALKWTNKSTYNVADELRKKGHNLSYQTVARLLKQMKYSLQSNIKSKEDGSTSGRDAQFKYINNQIKSFAREEAPTISVDTKKKELVGEFKNPGRVWRKKGQPEEVNVYDFSSLSGGKAIPYGTYDIIQNMGFVNVGITADTADFSVNSVKRWWKQLGKKNYPQAKKILITADCGGSNGNSNRLWKNCLQKFANETGLHITVCHYPKGTSKWNKIEHRLFSFISMNWKGKPLISYEVIINLIKATKTNTGLKVYAMLDKRKYKKGKKISDKEMEKINIEKHELHPDWNYTILPNI